ncbi:MAG: glycogen debranching enzyme N-terminal domain-containing protein [Candidatus Micrarchaeota archaeon]|nr:glycogen debranching enzyme N-terminal domain-containing protein [Candidatus Micrarchaeota archaeon]
MLALSAFELTPAKAGAREWLIANGLGGYSSSTAIGMNTRKYHGLLVASLPQGRMVMLSKLEEHAVVAGEQLPLSTNQYPGKVYPEGYRRQIGFSFAEFPEFHYSVEGMRLAKSVRMVYGKNTSLISYRMEGSGEIGLSIRPLLAMRKIHQDPSAQDKSMEFRSDRFGFWTANPQMRMSCSNGSFVPSPDNYRNMLYPAEQERGYPHCETLFSPGVFSCRLQQGEELHLSASVEGIAPSEALELLDRQQMRRMHLIRGYEESSGIAATDFSQALLKAADSFIASRKGRRLIVAGYPWFFEWGRDTMVSLPGLLVYTGRHALAREILFGYSGKIEDGLIPNFITEEGEMSYTSSDASLWYLNAIRHYAEWTGDYSFVQRRLWKPMKQIISGYIQGNSLARMDGDCLLRVLSASSTWMDAQIGGSPVTPRKGKPVEINALWYSNLNFMQELAEKFEDKRMLSIVSPIIEACAESFQKFLSLHEAQLFDVIEPNDATLRPNQIFAVALPHSPLNSLQKKLVFNLVRSKLYTPLGLRTLPHEDSRCHEAYRGNQQQRDEAYHQGMIWPWLLGAFYDAQLEVYPSTQKQILNSLRPLWESMKSGEGCAGTLPEMYEPATGKPAGAISQAWSIAEIIRIYTKAKAQRMSQTAWQAASAKEASKQLEVP